MQKNALVDKHINDLILLYKQRKFTLLLERAKPLIKGNRKSVFLNKLLGATYSELQDYGSALKQYKFLAKLYPSSYEAFFLVGSVLALQNKPLEAIQNYKRSVFLNPDYFESRYNLGCQYLLVQEYEAAVEHFDKAVQIKSTDPSAKINLGIANHKAGNLDAAIRLLSDVVSTNPNIFEAQISLGLALIDQLSFDAAIKVFQSAEAINPKSAYALYGYAMAYKGLSNFAEARLQLEKALLLDEKFEKAIFELAMLEKRNGQIFEARSLFQRADKFAPGNNKAKIEIARIDRELGDFESAISILKTCALDTTHSEVPHFELGLIYFSERRDKEASYHFKKALSLNSQLAEAHCNLGSILSRAGEVERASSAFEKALEIEPSYAGAITRLIYLKKRVCDWRGIEPYVSKIADLGIVGPAIPPFMALPLEDNPRKQRQRSERFSKSFFMHTRSPKNIGKRTKSDRIRIGYFSGDIHDHALMHLISGLFREHDKTKFEISIFSYGNEKTGPLRRDASQNVEKFIDASGWNVRRFALELQENPIDIAIDLSGYTDNGRPELFASRLAPIQISFLGYPSTMGADFIDFLVADHILIPVDMRPHYSENIIYMPHCFQPNDNRRIVPVSQTTRSQHDLPVDGLVYCCFCNSFKISAAVFNIWLSLLRDFDDSVIWLSDMDELTKLNLRREASQFGINPKRLVFAPKLKNHDHLERLLHADIFLDTAEVSAGTNASDAIWCGLPVVTYAGNQMAARMAASINHASNLEFLVTKNLREYEECIRMLSRDRERLSDIKKTLRASVKHIKLFDTEGYTKDFEASLTQVYTQYLDGKSFKDVGMNCPN